MLKEAKNAEKSTFRPKNVIFNLFQRNFIFYLLFTTLVLIYMLQKYELFEYHVMYEMKIKFSKYFSLRSGTRIQCKKSAK